MDNNALLHEATRGSTPADLLEELAGVVTAERLARLMTDLGSDDRRIRALELLRGRPDERGVLCGMSRDVMYYVLVKFDGDRCRLRALALLHATLCVPVHDDLSLHYDLHTLLGCFADDHRPEAVRELCTADGVPRSIVMRDVSNTLARRLDANANRLRALTYLVESGALVFVNIYLGEALRSVDHVFVAGAECAAALVLVWRAFEAKCGTAVKRRKIKTILDASVSTSEGRPGAPR